jgi:hypothetical protein
LDLYYPTSTKYKRTWKPGGKDRSRLLLACALVSAAISFFVILEIKGRTVGEIDEMFEPAR